jgi:hypothetical protein
MQLPYELVENTLRHAPPLKSTLTKERSRSSASEYDEEPVEIDDEDQDQEDPKIEEGNQEDGHTIEDAEE